MLSTVSCTAVSTWPESSLSSARALLCRGLLAVPADCVMGWRCMAAGGIGHLPDLRLAIARLQSPTWAALKALQHQQQEALGDNHVVREEAPGLVLRQQLHGCLVLAGVNEDLHHKAADVQGLVLQEPAAASSLQRLAAGPQLVAKEGRAGHKQFPSTGDSVVVYGHHPGSKWVSIRPHSHFAMLVCSPCEGESGRVNTVLQSGTKQHHKVNPLSMSSPSKSGSLSRLISCA